MSTSESPDPWEIVFRGPTSNMDDPSIQDAILVRDAILSDPDVETQLADRGWTQLRDRLRESEDWKGSDSVGSNVVMFRKRIRNWAIVGSAIAAAFVVFMVSPVGLKPNYPSPDFQIRAIDGQVFRGPNPRQRAEALTEILKLDNIDSKIFQKDNEYFVVFEIINEPSPEVFRWLTSRALPAKIGQQILIFKE